MGMGALAFAAALGSARGADAQPAAPAAPAPPPPSAAPAAPASPPPAKEAAPAPESGEQRSAPPPYPPPLYPAPVHPPPPGAPAGYGAYPGAYRQYPYGSAQYPRSDRFVRPRRLKPRYPDDAAVRTTPFFDVLASVVNWEKRLDHFLIIGLQGGAFVGRARLAGFVGLFSSDTSDDYRQDSNFDFDDGFTPVDSDPAAVLFGGSLGYALASSRNFVLAPGLKLVATDESDYGAFVGVAAPFEWVPDSGIRIGFEIAVGRAFGGEYEGRCDASFGPAPSCSAGEVRAFNREAAAGFYSHFQIGWGFDRPKPLPSAVSRKFQSSPTTRIDGS